VSERVGDVIGGYELEKKLGAGDLTVVWLARTAGKSASKRVVLKVLHQQLAQRRDVRAQFEEGARLTQRLEHPNVVKLVATGRDQGRCYLAMELIDGVDLRSALTANEGPLPGPLAVALIADATRGLHHAHRHGLVHRDISLGNVMVDVEGRVRLLDFGISGVEVAPDADVHAMGVALCELVAGRTPLSEKKDLPRSLFETLANATSRQLTTASELEAVLRAFLREFPPPQLKDIGRQVAAWKKKLAEPQGPGADWEVDTDPQREPPLPSVMLAPELEAVAERHHGEPKKKKKPRAKK
jgi:serine/threonine protein kinase